MIDDLSQRMSNAVGHLEKEFNTIRTSRANPSMLDNIFADAYGSKTPLNQLGNISTPDPGLITIQVWDTSLLKSIENSILDSGLGINPQIDGQIIRLPIPKLSEERREELTKIASIPMSICQNGRGRRMSGHIAAITIAVGPGESLCLSH